MKHILRFCASAGLALLLSIGETTAQDNSLVQIVTASDVPTTNREFGVSMDVDGDILVVGAATDNDIANQSGAAYVYNRDTDGTWTEIQKLKTLDASEGALFGIAVAISGNSLIVGALEGQDRFDGDAYIFSQGANGQWSQQARLSNNFGGVRAVAIQGDTALVASNSDNRLFIYNRDGLNWPLVQTIDIESIANQIGQNLAIDGNRIVTGAASGTEIAILEKDSSGEWIQSSTVHFDLEISFGALSVDIEGDTIVVGARSVDNSRGSVFIVTRQIDESWVIQQELVGSDAEQGDLFGYNVKLNSDELFVGALLDPADANSRGSVYEFSRDSAGIWTEFDKITSVEGLTQTIAISLAASDLELFISAFASVGVFDTQGIMDGDLDGVLDDDDNCPIDANADQADNDDDGTGDVCDVDDDNDYVLDSSDNCPIDANTDQGDYDGDGLGDVCDDDDDSDGVNDVSDSCPISDTSSIVVIDDCDSGVSNHVQSNGCTILDDISACAAGASNHGKFVSCVSKRTNLLKKAVIITGQQKGAIQSCAAQANIP